MSYPPLTFVRVPSAPSSPCSSPTRGTTGSPRTGRKEQEAPGSPSEWIRSVHHRPALAPSKLRLSSDVQARQEAGPAGATVQGDALGAEKRVAPKKRPFWGSIIADSDSSQENEDEEYENEETEHPLRAASLSLFATGTHITSQRKKPLETRPAGSIEPVPYLTKKRKLIEDDDFECISSAVSSTMSSAPMTSRIDAAVTLDDQENGGIVCSITPRLASPPVSPLSERNSNVRNRTDGIGCGSPWLSRKRQTSDDYYTEDLAKPYPKGSTKRLDVIPLIDLEDNEADSDKENNKCGIHMGQILPQTSVTETVGSALAVKDAPSGSTSLRDVSTLPKTKAAKYEHIILDEDEEIDNRIIHSEPVRAGSVETTVSSTSALKFIPPFTEDEVKKWSKARLQAWKQRHRNANAYYYRFTDPTVAQSERKLSRDEHLAFMKRYEEFQRNGWRVGTSWGLFSMALPSRVGYQCANHYRKLIKEGKLSDSSFKLDTKGEVKLAEGADTRGHCGLENKLSDVWDTKEVKEIERCVDRWIAQYHDGMSSELVFPDEGGEESGKRLEEQRPKKKRSKKTETARTVNCLESDARDAFKEPCSSITTDQENDDNSAMTLEEHDQESAQSHTATNVSHDTDGSFDEPVEENIFVYAARDEDRPAASTSFKRPRNIWKDFIIGEASSNDIAHAGMRKKGKSVVSDTAGRGRGAVKGKQLDLSRFIPGVKPAPVVVEATPIQESNIDKTIIPHPIPRSWAKAVQPFDYEAARGQKQVPGSRYIEASVDDLDLESLGSFEAILMDPPWNLSPTDKHRSEKLITPEELGTWKITNKLIPRGFLFVWTEKELIPRVLSMARKWGFQYVENFAWVKFDVNNKIHCEDYTYFRKSKLTLLMLRKQGDIELRHQRNPDVKFDFVQKGREKTAFAYEIIETLLPTATYNPKTGKGKMLQLWCTPQQRRSGWTFVNLT